MYRFVLAIVLFILPQSGTGPYDLEFVEVRDGVWMAYRPEPLRPPVFGNVTIIINDVDVVVVDTGPSPRAARRIIEKIRALTDAPVTTLINTHGHEDHVFGNQVFVDAYPDVEIIARPETVEYLESGRVQARLQGFSREMSQQQQTGELEADRVARRGLNGDALVARHLRRYYEQDIYAVRNEYRDVRVMPPGRTFEERMVLERADRTIELLAPGEAGSGVVVHLPRERLLVTGDLVTHPVPFGFARLQTEWLESLRRIVELEFDDAIPGHGEQLIDKQYVQQVVDLVAFELAEVRKSVRAGRSADATAWDITFMDWGERFVGFDPLGLYYFNEWFVKPAVERAHAELSGRDR